MSRTIKHGDLARTATEVHRSGTKTMVTWLVPLLMVWTSYILTQHFEISRLTTARSLISAAQDKPGEGGRPYLEAAVATLGADVPRTDGAIPRIDFAERIRLGQASTVAGIVNRDIELPFGIKFGARATLVPTIWCMAVIAVVWYLRGVRSRCYGLLARELEARRLPRILEERERLLHRLPWWMAPGPSTDGRVLSARAFRDSLRGSRNEPALRVLRALAATVLIAMYAESVYVSWASAALVEVEERNHKGEPGASSYRGATLLDLEWFLTHEMAVLLTFAGVVTGYFWLTVGPVPDGPGEASTGISRRDALTTVAAGIVASAVVPMGNVLLTRRLATTRLVPRTKSTPSRHTTTRGAILEKRIASEMGSGSLSPAQAVAELMNAVRTSPESVRLWDYAAALCSEHALEGPLATLVDSAQAIVGQSLPRATRPVAPINEPADQMHVVRILLRGFEPGAAKNAGGRRCVAGEWVPRQRRHSKPTLGELLATRIVQWSAPGWKEKWAPGSRRQQRGWNLPNSNPRAVTCS